VSSKILITGAEGQLGRVLQQRLGASFNLIPTAKSPTEMAIKKRNVRKMDITNLSSVKSCIEIENPDTIINCAAMTDVDVCEKNHKLAHNVNVRGLQNIIKSIDRRVKIIQISTDYVFEGKDGPYSETDPTCPLSYYGRSKLEAENILIGSLRPYSIIRGSVLYGNPLNSKPNFFSWVYDSLLQNRNIKVVIDQTCNPAWLPSLSDALMKMILFNSEGIYHFGSDDHLSRYSFAILIASIFGFDSDLITPVKSNSIPFIAKRPIHSGLNIEKISEELDVVTLPTIECLKMIKNQILVS